MLGGFENLSLIDLALVMWPGLGAGINGLKDRTEATNPADSLHIMRSGHYFKRAGVVAGYDGVEITKTERLGAIDNVGDFALHVP